MQFEKNVSTSIYMVNKKFLNRFKRNNTKSQILFIIDSLVINGAYLITGGIFLSGYAIYLGAGDFLTALLNSGTHYATILSLLSFFLLEKRAKRKNLLLTLNIISRTLMVIIAILPMIFRNNTINLILITIFVIASEIVWGIYRIGWTVWMMTTVPKESKTEYIYSRTFYTRLFMSVISVLVGFVLDIFNKSYTGFLVIFAFSYILSLLDVYILKQIDEPEYKISGEVSLNLKKFFEPVHIKEYRSFLIFIFLFYLGYTMATSFTPTYMIRYLVIDYKYISIFSFISQGVMIVTNPYWSKIERAKGFGFTICAGAFFTISPLLILSFVTKDTWILLFLSNITAGIGMGGFTSLFTYRYEIMPDDDRTIYEGWYYFSFGLSVLIAPFMGKLVIDMIPEFTTSIFQHSQIQLLNLISFVLLSILLYLFFINPSKGRNKI